MEGDSLAMGVEGLKKVQKAFDGSAKRPLSCPSICASNADRNRDGATTSAAWRQSRRAMGKGGIVFYFWGADACEKRLAWPKYCS